MSSIIPIPTSRINYIETRLNAAERLLALHSAQIIDNAGNIAGNAASISTINGEIILEQDAIQVNLTSILNNAKVLVDRTKSNTVSNTFGLKNSNNTTLSLYPNPLKITASDNSTLFQVDTSGNLAAKNAVSAASYYLSNNGNPIDVGTKVNDAANSLISLGGKIDKIVECVGSMVTILKNMGMIVTASAVLDGVLTDHLVRATGSPIAHQLPLADLYTSVLSVDTGIVGTCRE
jgi:hypothetical protein